MADVWVHDARNGNILGPFGPEAGETMRKELCAFVYANSGLGRALGAVGAEAQVTGPFYVYDSPRPRFGPGGEILGADGRPIPQSTRYARRR